MPEFAKSIQHSEGSPQQSAAKEQASRGFVKPANWDQMSPTERREARFQQWLAPTTSWASDEIAEKYRLRAQRLKDVVDLKKPDRVPCIPLMGGYVADYAGLSHRDIMYDYEKASKAIRKFNLDFPLDYQTMGNFWPGPVYDLLQYQTYQWPGGSLPHNAPYQAVEGEYMLPEEYDQFIADPDWFLLTTYLPRAFKALSGWKKVSTLVNMNELVGVPGSIMPFGDPEMQGALQAMVEAGEHAKQWAAVVGQLGRELISEHGRPRYRGGFTKAPFDIIGDTLRGTRGIMLDIYRRPDKLLTAMERILPHAIEAGVGGASRANVPMIFIPLHKGADGFVSDPVFRKFYWPSFEALLRGLIAEGLVPYSFAEGSYNQRLDVIAEAELPSGATLWGFDQSDMAEVKKKIGGWAAFMGNVPLSLMHAGSAGEVTEYVKQLILSVGGDGGYVLATGASIDNASEESLKAFIAACEEYGRY